MEFNINTSLQPRGDQPSAIKQLSIGIQQGEKYQTLLGVTGSGKTLTMAHVIQNVAKPTLVLSHNKTLVSQLYGEFKNFFPENSVEYFVSYYDYYQPEAYIPVSNTYIEKDLQINEEIDMLRLKAISSLLSGRRDIIVVASVSCIYGAGNPSDYKDSIIYIIRGEKPGRNNLLHRLVNSLYSRTTGDFRRGNFRVTGDTVDIFPAYSDEIFRILFWGDEIEDIQILNPDSGTIIRKQNQVEVFPANMYVAGKDTLQAAICEIQDDLLNQINYFNSLGKFLEAKRLEERVNFDLEMIREMGYCSGIENYSRYLDRRPAGVRPFCLLDYFPEDFLLMVDESHVTIPQVRAMYGGDRSRKQNLVEYGFRLPSALDNRPLTFAEFENIVPQTVFVSATPADYELQLTGGVVVEQIIRPTGLLDPDLIIKPAINQVDDLMVEIEHCIKQGNRCLVTTLTKRMAEELSKFLLRSGINCTYIHSDIKTLDRVNILHDLRAGKIDVLIGVNLLREGLDLPEVALVAVMDADKEGFLRNDKSLIQTIGRAARNVEGRVVLYADKITASIRKTIEDNARKRKIQMDYNALNQIIPKTISKLNNDIFKNGELNIAAEPENIYEIRNPVISDPVIAMMSKSQLIKLKDQTTQQMNQAAKKLDFLEAARLRDEIVILEKSIKEKK